MEASQRDKAMRPMSPFPPEKDGFRFYIIVTLYIQSTAVSSTEYYISLVCLLNFGRDINNKSKIMSLEVVRGCHT